MDERNDEMQPLEVNFDIDCLYYKMFDFQTNQMTSLHEDYYQVYFK